MPGSGAMGALMKHPFRKPSLEGTMVYFSCDDCAITTELAIQNGGSVYKSKWSIGQQGFIAIIGDTEGNAIGLHSSTSLNCANVGISMISSSYCNDYND